MKKKIHTFFLEEFEALVYKEYENKFWFLLWLDFT